MGFASLNPSYTPRSPLLGEPTSRARAVADALPGAGAGRARQAAAAVGVALARRHAHVHGAVAADAAAHVEAAAAVIGHVAVHDVEAVTIGLVAIAPGRLDHHAPAAVVGGRGGCRAHRTGCRRHGEQ